MIEIPKDSPHRRTWKDFRTLAVVLTRTEQTDVETFETRLYLSSLPLDAHRLAQAIRSHWAIENTLHWSIDVTFGEDHHRLLDRNGVCNLSAIRRLCVAILRRDTTSKLGAKNKRFQAALNPHDIREVLGKAGTLMRTAWWNDRVLEGMWSAFQVV